jgi:UDP-glucose 4-epimerase
MKNILVTGGAGFIGSHTVDALLACGDTVTVLDNFSSGKRTNLPESHRNLRVITGDIRDGNAVCDVIAGATHVLHLAAQISVQSSIADPIASCNHNVAGFLNILQAARAAGIRRVVYASSAAVYGVPRELPLTESSPAAPISPYGLEKLINDQYAALYRDLFGLSTLGLRYFNVYGPRQDAASPYSGVISKWSAALATGKPLRIFGDGGQTRDFVFVGDVAKANVLALSSEAIGVCNVGTGKSVTLLEFIDTLEHVVGRPAERRFEPGVPGDIRASAMSPQRLASLMGFTPSTPLHEGLAAICRGG